MQRGAADGESIRDRQPLSAVDWRSTTSSSGRALWRGVLFPLSQAETASSPRGLALQDSRTWGWPGILRISETHPDQHQTFSITAAGSVHGLALSSRLR